ncbi:reverse transcriptase domain-containing protein [Tanacetum coccineum]
MRTRSSSNLVGESSPNPTTSNPKRRNRRRSKQPFSLEESPVDTMADQRTMAELLRAPTEGYAEAIVVPPILAEHFELKHSLINMMTSDQFFGLEKDNPHDHIRWFNKITSTIKYKDVPNSAIKLMLFPFSLAGAARRWLEKEPLRSILTWEDLVSKFINEFFPPSRTTNLQNEISNFEQRFGESFHEAWDCYKDLLHACPHHGFTELHQLDTFYNALNPTDQDSLNFAAVGNLLERSTRDVLTIIENKSKVRNSRNKSIVSQEKSSDVNSSSSSDLAKLTHAINQQTSAVTTAMTAILKQFQPTSPPASVKVVEEICVTCGGAHPYYQCVANQTRPPGFVQQNGQNNQNRFSQPQGYNRGNNFNQNATYQVPIQQNQNVPLSELEKFKKTNEANMKAMQTQINNVKNELRNEMQNSIQTSMSNQTNELKNMMASFFQMNTASTSGTGSLPSNTVANPKGELKAITTRSGLVLDGPTVPMPPPFINPEEDERVEETLTDPEHGEFTIKVPPPLVQKAKPPSQRNYVVHQRDPRHPHIPYPSRMNQEKRQEKDEVQIHKFWHMFKQLHINISLADALILIPKYQKMLKSLLSNKEKLIELANTPLNENCSAVILKKLPKKLGDPGKFLIPCGFSELKYASDSGTATNKPKQQQQQVTPTTTTISNIKLPILKKEEYDIWAMEMEHYLEYIDNDVWKVIQNGNSKKRISTGKDGVVRILPPVSAAEIHAVEKERKARTILLMAIPKEHLRRFHGMDDAKEIWEASQDKDLELEAHGAEVSTEDANHKFLRSLPPAWSNSRNENENQTSSTNKVKSGHTGAYSTYTPTSSNNIQEREVPAGFADEVIYSLFAKQSEDLDLLHEDLEQIDDVDIEEMDINWQIAMIAIRMKKFYKKTGRRVMIDGNKPGRHTFEKKRQIIHSWQSTQILSRFTKTNSFKGVPHPLSGDYTPKPQKEIDDSLYVYGKKGPQKPEISESDDNSTEHSTYQSNDNEGSCGNTSEHSSESESESISVPNEMSTSKSDHPLKNMEETKAQGRKTHDLDPLVSLVQELVTPSKTVNASGEEQVKDISPTTLEAAEILTKSLSTFSIQVIERRKAHMTEEEETQASRKIKEQILQEEAGLAKAIRLDALEKALEKEEVAKQVHLDSLIAQRMAEEQELTEEQEEKRQAQSI